MEGDPAARMAAALRAEPNIEGDPGFMGMMEFFSKPPWNKGLPTERMRPSDNVEYALPPWTPSQPLSQMTNDELDARAAYMRELNRRLIYQSETEQMQHALQQEPKRGSLADQAGYFDIGR